MAKHAPARSVDEYLARLAPKARAAVEEVRELIHVTAPELTERISYGIPTFDLAGRYLIYLAGWQEHISLYPVTSGLASAFPKELEPYWKGKGTLQFPLAKPLPIKLIRRLVAFRVKEGKTPKK
jgi:uncharacterized protein YdhG (YjbR/CyaY superfamily)